MLLAGVLLSGAVLNQPGLSFLYVGFTVLVWLRFLRQKKGKRFLDDFAFCLETRTWTYMTVSVLVCAAVFLTCLFARSGFQNVFRFMPYLFTDPEYDYSACGNARGFFLQKLLNAVQAYGLYCVIPALLIVILSVLYACGLPREKRETFRRVLFALSCAVWVLSCVPSFRVLTVRPPDNFFFYPVPMFWFGFVCHLLGSKQNKHLLFFWTVSLCASLCVDYFSNIALSIAAPISCIADLVFFVDLVRELRPEQLCDYSAEQGQPGYILYVSQWRLPEE